MYNVYKEAVQIGRELKRKQAKMEGRSVRDTKIKPVEDKKMEIKKYIKLIIIIILILILLYLFIGIVITKDIKLFKNDNNTVNEVNNPANTILAKDTLRQVEEEYYVYFYDFDDTDSDIESSLTSKLSDSKIYRVNTKDSFNANYIIKNNTDSSNTLVNDIENLKIKSPTLVKVVSQSIVESYETSSKILEYLNK